MKTKERIKTILLAVLLAGAVFLTYLTWTSYMGTNTGGGDTVTIMATGQTQGVIAPFAISYKTETGRFGAAYHAGSVSSVYEKVAPLITEAIETAGSAKNINKDVWNNALSHKGVLVDFEGNIPLFALAGSLGTQWDGADAYGRYLLITENGMFLKDTWIDEYYAFAHELEAEQITEVLAGLNASKCLLAYEAGSSRVSGETLVFDGNISSFAINSINVTDNFGDAQLNSLLKVFGMNYNTCGKHTEQDGSRVYIEDLSILKISPDGYVTYESEEEGELALSIPAVGATPTDRELLDGANNLMSSLSSFAGGDASLYLREFYEDGSVKYGRSFGGIPIDRSGSGYSAEIYFNGKRVTRLSFHMRAYTAGTTVVTALPQKLAIASVPGRTFGVLSLRYTDNASGGIEATWYVKK